MILHKTSTCTIAFTNTFSFGLVAPKNINNIYQIKPKDTLLFNNEITQNLISAVFCVLHHNFPMKLLKTGFVSNDKWQKAPGFDLLHHILEYAYFADFTLENSDTSIKFESCI